MANIITWEGYNGSQSAEGAPEEKIYVGFRIVAVGGEKLASSTVTTELLTAADISIVQFTMTIKSVVDTEDFGNDIDVGPCEPIPRKNDCDALKAMADGHLVFKIDKYGKVFFRVNQQFLCQNK